MMPDNPDTPQTAAIIYREQLDDYTTVDRAACECEERGFPTQPELLTPRLHKPDTLEVRCRDCGAMWHELYWSNMKHATDERDRDASTQ